VSNQANHYFVPDLLQLAALLTMVSLSCNFVILLFLFGVPWKITIINGNNLLRLIVFDDVLDDAVWRSELFNVRLAVVFCVSERDYLYPLESLQLVYSIIQI
jgi:hypothetical protein